MENNIPQNKDVQHDQTISKMSQALASGRSYYAFLVAYLVLMSALGSFVNDMYSPSLPSMCKFFGCSISLGQMGLTMGMIGLALGQFILGPVSDRYGRKPVLIAAVLLFIVAAIASTFSKSIHVFNICRLFQGMGASGGYFLARTIPADVFSGHELAKLMALVGAINGVAPASAPVLGGVTADALGWKGVFYVLSGFAFVVLCLSPMLKESLSVARRTKGAWWKSIPEYKELLKNKYFMIHVSFKGVALGFLFSYVSSSPFILQTHYGLSQTVYGLVIGFNAIFVAVGSMIAVRFKPLKKASTIGAIIMAVGVAMQSYALWHIHNIWIFEGCMITILFALGMIFTTTNTLAMNEGRERAGEASAILGIAGYVVGAIVAPLSGIGNVLHSTAITYIVVTTFVVVLSFVSGRLNPDLEK